MTSIELYEDFMENSYDKKIVLFGTGDKAMHVLHDYLLDEEIAYLCDNNNERWGTFKGFEVFSPSKLIEDNGQVVVVITSAFTSEIYRQLKEMRIKYVYPYTILRFKVFHQTSYYYDVRYYGVNWMNPYKMTNNVFGNEGRPNNEGFKYRESIKLLNENIEKIDEARGLLYDSESKKIFDAYIKKIRYNYKDYSDLMDPLHKQYFNDEIFSYVEDEVFIDAGSYDGQTTKDFIEAVQNRFKKIYCFEPNSVSYDTLIKNLNDLPGIMSKCEVYKQGLSNRNDKMKFNSNGGSGSRISENGDTEIETCRLDDKIKEKVTFIKMDIEGAERDALIGAEKIITTDKPKLAICIYHKPSDLWEIPILIKKLVPAYKLYIRHHFHNTWEKVLYAMI